MEEQRKSHKGLWVIGAVVVILLFCVFFFRVKKVSIEGNTYYSSREMEEKFQSNIFEKNILTFLAYAEVIVNSGFAICT